MHLYTEQKYIYFCFGVGLHKLSIIHVNYLLCYVYVICCVLFCYEYTKILPLEDYQENTERVFVTCKRRLIYIFSNSFRLLSLSLSLLYKSFPLTHTQTHPWPSSCPSCNYQQSVSLLQVEGNSFPDRVRLRRYRGKTHCCICNSKSRVLIGLCHNDTRDRDRDILQRIIIESKHWIKNIANKFLTKLQHTLNYGNGHLVYFFSQHLYFFSWISFAVRFRNCHLFSQVKVLLTDLQNGFRTGKVKFKINISGTHFKYDYEKCVCKKSCFCMLVRKQNGMRVYQC